MTSPLPSPPDRPPWFAGAAAAAAGIAALAAINAGTWALGQYLAREVVPGWVKGPLIDPAAPYSPENAVVLCAALVCVVMDVYALLLVGARRYGARAAWVPWLALALAVTTAEVGVRAWLSRNQVTLFRPHPTLHWQIRPNLQDFPNLSGGGKVTTNEDGMRNVTVPREKAADEYRILVLGDSSNFGHGVENDEVWSAVLEKALAGHVPGKRVEVLNGACPGWTTYQALEFMHTIGGAYHPDFVIAGFNNDPGPDYFGDKARIPTGATKALDTVLWRMESFLLAREVVLSTVRRFFPPPDVHYIAREAGAQPTYGKLGEDEAAGLVPRVPQDEFLANVHQLYEEGVTSGYRFGWINMPINRAEPDLVDRYVNPAYRAAVADLATKDGFPVFDVDARWLRTREPEIHIIGHVFHPSAKGHRRLAEQLAHELLTGGLLPGAEGDVPIGGPPPAATEATLRFGYSAFTPVHAHIGAVLAAHPELIAASGLTLELHAYTSGKAQGEDVASGALDAFFTCEVPAIQMVGGRTDVRIVASPGALGRVAVVADGRRIHTLADLAGKRVGVTPGATTAMDWATWGQGLGATEVPVQTDDLEAALAEGRVDAVVAWDPWVERMLADAPGERVVLKERAFWSEVAVSVPWATYAPGRAETLVKLLSAAMQIAAEDRPRWDAEVAAGSGWAPAIVKAVADRNDGLAGRTADPEWPVTKAVEQDLARALAFVRLPDVGLPTLLDPALRTGHVSAQRYTANAQFNPGSAPKPGPGGGPPGKGPPGKGPPAPGGAGKGPPRQGPSAPHP